LNTNETLAIPSFLYSSCSRHRASSSQGFNGEVEEPHRPQPVVQGPQERYQEAEEAQARLHQRDGPEVLEEPEVREEAQQEERRGRIRARGIEKRWNRWGLVSIYLNRISRR